jgi:hypothetical protein
MEIILDGEQGERWLRERGLLDANGEFTVPVHSIDAALLSAGVMQSGRSAVVLVVTAPDGTQLIARTTLRLLSAAVAACNARELRNAGL